MCKCCLSYAVDINSYSLSTQLALVEETIAYIAYLEQILQQPNTEQVGIVSAVCVCRQQVSCDCP